jgi:hypothetical protein
MQLFDLMHPEALRARENPIKVVRFQFRKIKVGNLGVFHKTTLEGDHQT